MAVRNISSVECWGFKLEVCGTCTFLPCEVVCAIAATCYTVGMCSDGSMYWITVT